MADAVWMPLFLCAGASRLPFWSIQNAYSVRKDVDSSYGTQAFTALERDTLTWRCCVCSHAPEAAMKERVKQGVKGKLVLVSSVLGYFSMVGYSTYSPGSFAFRSQ